MKIEDYILITYPTVQPFESIKSIESRLKEKDYLVVSDEENKFYGILTPSDILSRPYNLVIDCLTPKRIIQTDDTFIELADKFKRTPSEALPVFRHGEFLGILEKSNAVEKLKSRMDDFRKESMISQNVKTAFLRNLSHEVRTPLNHILGFMGIVADLSPEEIESNRKEYYTIIQKSSEQFLSIMNDLIELSRFYSGDKVYINNENISIESIFAEIKANFEGKAILYNGKFNISYHNPDSTLMMFTDSKKIKLIIHRLIDCAIKLMQKEDDIEFGCELFANKQTIRFYIKNANTQTTNVPDSIQSNTTRERPYPEYSFQCESDFSMELAKKMIELFDGILDIEEFGIGKKIIHFTIPYNSPKIRSESSDIQELYK